MKVIGFYNQKGGVGKTAMCIHLAAIFADLGQRILIVDWDSQCNSTQFFLYENENYYENGQLKDDVKTIENLLMGECAIHECISYKSYTRFSHFKKMEYHLGILPGTPNLNYINFFEYGNMFCLDNVLKTVKSEFDYVFIDLSPSDSTAVAIALSACDYVICPSEAELDSINGFKKLLDLVDDLNINYDANIDVLGIFINKYMQNRSYQKCLNDALCAFDDSYLFETYIPNDPRVPEARSELLPLESYARSCPANKALQKLAEEIRRKIKY